MFFFFVYYKTFIQGDSRMLCQKKASGFGEEEIVIS